MNKVYGYCRISRKEQSIDRQIRNITQAYPSAIIKAEAYTGTTIDRPQFNKLLKLVKAGDTVVFDSVSRMSRNAEDGIKIYSELVNKGVKLIFLKEHYIDSEVYTANMNDKIELIGTDEDEIFKGINAYFRKLAIRQIQIAFEQAQKEVDDLHQRTAEGIETARLNGKQVGQVKGSKLNVKKAVKAKEVIAKHCKDFGGSLTDAEVIELAKVSRNSYYKYKAELKAERQGE